METAETTNLLTTKEAADMLRVNRRTVLNWIERGAIPYVELPSGGSNRHEYRVPLHPLLASLSGNYDLSAELRQDIRGAKVP